MNVGDAGIHQLIEDFGASLIAPFFVLVLGFANSRLPWNRDSRGLRVRLTLSFATLLFAFTICVLMFQDRLIAVGLWESNRILYSLFCGVVIVLFVVGIGWLVYWKLRPRFWRDDSRS